MPPVLLLKNDKQFYGTLKPEGKADFSKLEKPAPPPNPMSNVALTTREARSNFRDRVTSDITALDTKEKPVNTDELIVPNTKKLENENDSTMNKVKAFIDNPFGIDTSQEDEEGRTWRKHKEVGEKVRITTAQEGIDDAIEVVSKPVVDLGGRLMGFVEDKAFNLILLLGGIYIASQFASGLGKNIGVGGGKKYKVEE